MELGHYSVIVGCLPPHNSEAQREEREMAKKSYALRNRRGYMDSTFDDGLRIVLQWMELRRRNFERLLQVWQKELYMLRRIWIARVLEVQPATWYIGLLPGYIDDFFHDFPRRQTMRTERYWLATHALTSNEFDQGLRYYAPGY